MSDDQMAAIRALCDAATPGPWKWWTSCSWRRLKSDRAGVSLSVAEPFVASDGHPDLDIKEADQAFIAAARTAVPALLDEVERLRAVVAKLSCGSENP